MYKLTGEQKQTPDVQKHANIVEKSTNRVWVFLLLLAFVGSAAWAAYVMVKNEIKYATPKPKDPLEDRSLFGR